MSDPVLLPPAGNTPCRAATPTGADSAEVVGLSSRSWCLARVHGTIRAQVGVATNMYQTQPVPSPPTMYNVVISLM